jgi:hypothetical protein
LPRQWAVAGYLGAIASGKTICGTLFGGVVFMGYLHGADAAQAPEVQDKSRSRAIESVRGLYRGFIERFGDTDCQTLTGCDMSKAQDGARFMEQERYRDTCWTYFGYVLAACLAQTDSAGAGERTT